MSGNHQKRLKGLFFAGERLAGALYWKDLLEMAQNVGFCKPIAFKCETVRFKNLKVEEKIPGELKDDN